MQPLAVKKIDPFNAVMRSEIRSIPLQSLADAGTTWRGVSCCRHQFVSLAQRLRQKSSWVRNLSRLLASGKLFV
jgi:hypothetical protein